MDFLKTRGMVSSFLETAGAVQPGFQVERGGASQRTDTVYADAGDDQSSVGSKRQRLVIAKPS